MRRGAFVGLVLVGVAVAVGLVLWLAILGLGADNDRASAATARPATVAAHACFVGIPECSQTPCVVFVSAGGGCPSSGVMAVPQVRRVSPPLTAALAQALRRLRVRRPAGPAAPRSAPAPRARRAAGAGRTPG